MPSRDEFHNAGGDMLFGYMVLSTLVFTVEIIVLAIGGAIHFFRG